MNTRGFTLVEIMMGASILAVVLVALGGAFSGQSFLNSNARNLNLAMNDATRIMEEIRRLNTAGSGCASGIPVATPPGHSVIAAVSTNNSWDAWLQRAGTTGGGGKSVQTINANTQEVVAVTCQDGTVDACAAGQPVSCADAPPVICPAVGAAPVACQADGRRFAPIASYCGVGMSGLNPPQVARDEWASQAGNTTFNPIRVTVAVGWNQQRRVIGSGSGGAEFVSGTRQVTSGKSTTTVNDTLRPTDANGNGVIESQAMLTTLVTCR